VKAAKEKECVNSFVLLLWNETRGEALFSKKKKSVKLLQTVDVDLLWDDDYANARQI